MQSLKTRAIVLRRTNYGESDRILNLLTFEGQKVSAVAKGVRKEKSKNAGGVELFSVSEVTIHRGKGDVGVLTGARLQTFYKDILNDYDRLQFGYEVLKKVNKLAEHVHEPILFSNTVVVFGSLANLKIDLRVVKAWFYLQTAEISGHGLNLSRDASNQPLTQETNYAFDIAEMSFVPNQNANFTSDHLKLLKVLKLKKPEVVAHISGTENYLDDIVSLAHAVAE